MRKFTKEQWKNLNEDEKVYYRTMNQVEIFYWNKLYKFITFLIAIGFVTGLFWLGTIQVKYYHKQSILKQKYGSQYNCYLCGLHQGKQCSCVYYDKATLDSIQNNKNLSKKILEELAESNTAICKDKSQFSEQGFNLS